MQPPSTHAEHLSYHFSEAGSCQAVTRTVSWPTGQGTRWQAAHAASRLAHTGKLCCKLRHVENWKSAMRATRAVNNG